MAKKNANARSKRVAKKKKVANRLKNELRRVDSVKSNPIPKSSGEVIELFLEDKDHFFKAYFTGCQGKTVPQLFYSFVIHSGVCNNGCLIV